MKTTRILSAVLAGILGLPCCTLPAGAAEPGTLKGDLNCDGAVTLSDAKLLLDVLVQNLTAETPVSVETVYPNADINENGTADTTDAKYILDYAVYSSTMGAEPAWQTIINANKPKTHFENAPAPAEDLADKIRILENQEDCGTIALFDEPDGLQFGSYIEKDRISGIVVYAEDTAELDWTIARNEKLKDAGIERSAYEQGGENCWLLTVSAEKGGKFNAGTGKKLLQKLDYYQSGEVLDLLLEDYIRPLCFAKGTDYCFELILDKDSSYDPIKVYADSVNASRCTEDTIEIETGIVVGEGNSAAALEDAQTVLNNVTAGVQVSLTEFRCMRLSLKDSRDYAAIWALCRQMNRDKKILCYTLLPAQFTETKYQAMGFNTEELLFQCRSSGEKIPKGFHSNDWAGKNNKWIMTAYPESSADIEPFIAETLMKWTDE